MTDIALLAPRFHEILRIISSGKSQSADQSAAAIQESFLGILSVKTLLIGYIGAFGALAFSGGCIWAWVVVIQRGSDKG